MRIVIAGGGTVAESLARQLVAEGHELSVVEEDPVRSRRFAEKLDLLTVTGNATSQQSLLAAGIEEAQLFLAVTSRDEVNVLACGIARAYNVPQKIARIRNAELTSPEAKFDLKAAGVDLAVTPDQVLVESMLQLIQTPGATDVAEFEDGKILLRGFRVPRGAPIAWKKLAELKEVSELESFRIVAISRRDRLIIPHGTDEVQPDDTLFVVVSEETLPLFLPFVNRRVEPVTRTVIYGATPVGIALATRLEKVIETVCLIEPDEERAEAAAAKLSSTTVFHGDGADPDVLAQAEVGAAGIFVAVTREDDANMLASVVAKDKGAKRVIVVSENPTYVSVFEHIGMDVVLNPRLITVGKILQFIRKGKIRSVVKLQDSEAEVLEMEVPDGSKIAGLTLQEIGFPEGAIIGAVLRNGTMHVANGATVLNTGDRVIIFTRPEAIPAVEKLLSRKRFL